MYYFGIPITGPNQPIISYKTLTVYFWEVQFKIATLECCIYYFLQMTLVVKQQDPPVPKSIEGDLLEKLVTVMSALYNTDMMVLDLSAFHKNEGKLNYQLY